MSATPCRCIASPPAAAQDAAVNTRASSGRQIQALRGPLQFGQVSASQRISSQIGFRKTDNAFLAVDDGAALQAAADRLSPAIIRGRQSVPHMQRFSPNASMIRSTGSQISS